MEETQTKTNQENSMMPVTELFTPVGEDLLLGQMKTTPAKKRPPHFLVSLIVLLVMSISVLAFSLLNPLQPTSVMNTATTPVVIAKPLFLQVPTFDQSVTLVEGEMLIEGKTLPNTTVAILSDVDEVIVDSDDVGSFRETLVVGEDGGLVQVVAFGDDNQERTLTYDLTATPSNVLGKTDTKTNNAKSDQNAVAAAAEKEKEEKIRVNPASAVDAGKVTTEKVIPTKPVELLKPAIAKPTKAAAEIKFKEEKTQEIEDFVLEKTEIKRVEKLGVNKLMSELNQEGTASAGFEEQERFQNMQAEPATETAEMRRHAVSGVVTSVEEGKLVLSHQVHRERVNTIYLNSSTIISSKGGVGLTVAEITVGMRLAVVGIPSDDGLLASRVHVIPGLASGVFEKNPVPTGVDGDASLTPAPTTSVSVTPAALSPSPSSSVSITPETSPSPTEVPSATVTPTESISPTVSPVPTEEPTPEPTLGL
ncbi:MAG TPA: hypothetical protein PKX78_03565 [Candidatus Woesebacteria bacterium]|nr:hypothetical protein [Candidatus Woesebacteria bacterium]